MALQNPQIGSTSLTLSTNASEQTYVAPFIAQMVANAAGTVGVLQRANVSITGVDETFDLTLSRADSVKLLNAFHVYKSDVGEVDGELDTSGGVTVDIIDDLEVDFKAALRAALDSAKSTGVHLPVNSAADASNCTIDLYLARECYVDTRDQLAYDTLANLLEASDLASFTMTLDVSGAAKNMFTQLDGEGALPARYRRTLFTQLPESNTEAYLTPAPTSDLSGNYNAESVDDIEFLPFRSGDKIYFVFDAVVGSASMIDGVLVSNNTGADITREVKDADYEDKVQVGSAGMAGLSSLSKKDAEYAGGASLTFSAPTKRRIGVAIKVAKDVETTSATAVSTSTAPFNILLKKGAEIAVIDPSGADYPYQVAAGLLSDVSEALVLTASALTGTHAMMMPPQPMAAAEVDLSGVDLANGGYASANVFPEALPAVQEAYGVFGAWLIVNGVNNKNAFVYNPATGNVEYRARIQTTSADTANLWYVSNHSKSGPVALSGTAAYSNAA
jgi:hypothetical protein